MASYEHTQKNGALRESLLLVAAFACLTLALTLLLAVPAHAMMLKGEVATTKMEPVRAFATLASESTEVPLPQDSTAVSDASQARPKCRPSDSFPPNFAGHWRCESVVVASAVPDVSAGQRLVSEINFVKAATGNVSMAWSQAGWTSTVTSLRVKGDTLATANRVNQYMTGNWTAASRDRYVQVSADQLVAESKVDQYVDGRYVGTYNTQSVLYRVEAPQAISLAK